MSVPETSISDRPVTFPFGATTRSGYLAQPAGPGPFPALVIIHEIYGLNDNIKDIARRFAREGYVALAVDLFADHNRVACMVRVMGDQLFRSLNNPRLTELRAALDFLIAEPNVDGAHIGAVGFCMGGAFAIAWACTDERLQAIAPFYGANPRPLAAVARACPVVGSYPDPDFTTSMGRTLEVQLSKAGIAHDIKIYPGTKHSFFNDQGRSYDAAASHDAWQRMLAFFGDHLFG